MIPGRTGSDPDLASQPRTINKGGGRRWIHAFAINGRYQRLRNVVASGLLLLFYATPWITVDGRPFIKLSFLSPSFVLFGNFILQHEIFRFVLLALLLVITLFAASALIGRAWCGYACPQTIFVEQIFGRIESLIEGPAAKRQVHENLPLNAVTLSKKVLKHLIFIAVSFSFAFTLVGIFTGTELLLSGENSASLWAVGILAAIAWFDGGYWREQFCHIACPYARFQSVMQDIQTRTIGYDVKRGEPRGRRKTEGSDVATGDCIDCNFCVRVCPSGIDIRQGASQLECTACARCVDACDSVMKSLHRPVGLIRYDALGQFEPEPVARGKLFRPRILIYGVLWLGLVVVGVWQFVNRDLHHVSLLNVKGAMPYFQSGGRVQNLLTLKVGNQDSKPAEFILSLDAKNMEKGVRLESPAILGPIASGLEMSIPVLLSVDESQVGSEVFLEVKSKNTGRILRVKKVIAGP